MTTETPAQRLGRLVRARRKSLKMTQADVQEADGPSTATLRLIEGGKHTDFRDGTGAALEAAIRWEPGSLDTVLGGGEPTLIGQPDQNGDDGPPPQPDRVDALNVGDGATAGIVGEAQRAWSRLIELAELHGDPAATFHAVIGSSDFYIDALLTMQAGPTAKPLLREIFNKVDEVIETTKERNPHVVEATTESDASSEGDEGKEAKSTNDAQVGEDLLDAAAGAADLMSLEEPEHGRNEGA